MEKDKSLVSKLNDLEGRRAMEKRLLARMSAPSALKAPAKIARGPAARDAAARRATTVKRVAGGSSLPPRRSIGTSNISQPSGGSKERKPAPVRERSLSHKDANKHAPISRERSTSQQSSGLLFVPRSPRMDGTISALASTSPRRTDWSPRSHSQQSTKPSASPNRDGRAAGSVEQIEDQLSAMEQKLRERAELNRLREEKEEIQQKLEEAWAAHASLKEVMETECVTLSTRMAELEDQLCDVTAERDQLLSQVSQKDAVHQASHDEWEEDTSVLKEELADVSEERDILREEVDVALLKQQEMEERLVQAQEERELLEEELVTLMETVAEANHEVNNQPSTRATAPAAVVPDAPAPCAVTVPQLDGDQLEELAQDILDSLKRDLGIPENGASALMDSVMCLQPSIAEVSTSSDWAEVNVCGELGSDLSLLWQILDINGSPELDNQYIFNCGKPSSDDGIVMLALCALKVLYPESVHLLTRGEHAGDGRGGAHDGNFSLGAVVNREVLVMHSDLFDQTANAHNVMSPGSSPDRRLSNPLIPEPVDTNSDPVFLQQLKGLEETSDPTVAQIRVTPSRLFTPDNAR